MTATEKTRSQILNRRQFLKISAAAGALLLGGRLLKRGLAAGPTTLKETRTLMGTIIHLTLITPDLAHGQAVINATFAEMERLITYFDHRQPGSLVTRLNRQGRLSGAPPELVDIIGRAIDYGKLTGGAFDITVKPLLDVYRSGSTAIETKRVLVDFRRLRLSGNTIVFNRPGMEITLDGMAKGRVVDAATAVLQANGFANIMVEAGGDLMGHGTNADGRPWRVGIANPRESGVLSVLPVSGQAAATSGDYMNSFTSDLSLYHIINPHTGLSPTELAAATVITPTAMDADALSTAVMVLGTEQGLRLINQLPHTEALLVTKQMQVIRSAGFPAA